MLDPERLRGLEGTNPSGRSGGSLAGAAALWALRVTRGKMVGWQQTLGASGICPADSHWSYTSFSSLIMEPHLHGGLAGRNKRHQIPIPLVFSLEHQPSR